MACCGPSIKRRDEKTLFEELKNNEEEIKRLDTEIDNLEKEYLAKIAKLLVMTQVHCEIKTDIYNEFDKAGVQTHVQEIDPSFNNN